VRNGHYLIAGTGSGRLTESPRLTTLNVPLCIPIMTENDTRDAQAARRPAPARKPAGYRERLKSKPLLVDSDADEAPSPATRIEALQGLLRAQDAYSAAFQSVAVAAVQILERALCFERKAADAALSLGQREKLNSMIDTAQEAVTSLRSALSTGKSSVMHLCNETEDEGAGDKPWWFALNDALGVLEEGTHRMASLISAQPDGSSSRELSEHVTQLLQSHHDALLLEADQWIS